MSKWLVIVLAALGVLLLVAGLLALILPEAYEGPEIYRIDRMHSIRMLDLLGSLQERLGMALLLVTHDLGVVAERADQVAIMYAGRIVESGPTLEVLGSPRHPYTRGLLQAVPRLDGAEGHLRAIEGTVPNPSRLPKGCAFHPRCPHRRAECAEEEPALEPTKRPPPPP